MKLPSLSTQQNEVTLKQGYLGKEVFLQFDNEIHTEAASQDETDYGHVNNHADDTSNNADLESYCISRSLSLLESVHGEPMNMFKIIMDILFVHCVQGDLDFNRSYVNYTRK